MISYAVAGLQPSSWGGYMLSNSSKHQADFTSYDLAFHILFHSRKSNIYFGRLWQINFAQIARYYHDERTLEDMAFQKVKKSL